MPNHDYFCPSCRWTLRDQYRSVLEGGRGRLPECPHCFMPMMWVVPVPRMDIRTDGEGASGTRFQKFTARDGRNQLVEIDSLRKLRQVERESEQLARNGEGQQIRFRAYEQNRSNLSVNTFGEGPAVTPLSAEAKRKFGLRGATTPVVAPADGTEPDYAYGPGVNDSNTSALPVD